MPFKNGARWDFINKITKEPDCEMVVICQELHKRKCKNIYMLHDAQMFHPHK